MKERFKWKITENEAYQILKASYMAEVEYRHREFIDDNDIVLNKIAKFVCNENQKFGALFCGLCGNGKTTILYALRTATYYLSKKMMFPNDIRFVIINSKEVIQTYKNQQDWKNLKYSYILAIDDLGVEPSELNEFGTIISPIKDILEYRYNEQLPTFITTNLTPKEIREVYGDRIADRFNEMMEVIIFKNKSYRK